MLTSQEKILIIKLSALGDFIQNLGIIRAIRTHHQGTHITLLTTNPYKDLAEKSGYVDEVIIDPRPKFYQLGKWLALKNTLNKANFTRVYDLQITDRTAIYYSLFKNPKPDWIGQIDKSLRDKSDFAFFRHKKMIENVRLKNITLDTLDWMTGDISAHNLQDKFVLIVPGCAPTRPEKRWPTAHYIALCQNLINADIQPVLIGTKAEENITNEISKSSGKILNLTDQTSLYDIAELARKATVAIGNDTGPMHIIGPTGCPSLVLFSGSSDPQKHAPLGQKILTLQENNIADISPEKALSTLTSFIN